MRFAKYAGLGLVGLVAVAAIGLIAIDRIGQTAPADPTKFLALANQYDVTIERDDYGVPHIFSKTDAGAAFGIGFAHSEDDFQTISDVVLATRGTLAAVKGRDAAVTDYLVHLFGVWKTLDAKYDTELPAHLRKILQAYADGVNYYAALHPGKIEGNMLPVTGRDVAAGFIFKTPFFYGLDQTLKKITDGTIDEDRPPVGSNGAAVAPSRSADGATRLLVNSHQPYTGPVAWYEAVIQSDEGWHVAGGFFPGTPFMLHGHNEHLGWANTVNKPDLADVYRLTLNPDNPDQYRLDGKWVNFEKSDAAIRVHLWGPFYWTVHRDVLRATQGPVLKTDHGTYAIRYAGMGEVRQVLQYYRLNKAKNRDEWLAAMRLQALPSINYIYADEKGNIGYVYNAQFPLRKPGVDWAGVLPGDRSDLIWHGYVPFDQVPQIWNPPSGFVFNSNNTPFQATAPADDLKPSDFPAWMGIQTNMTNRAYRALENFGSDTSITADEFRRYKYDLCYSVHSDIAHEITEVEAIDPGKDADLKAAQNILRGWNRCTDVKSLGAALGVKMGLNVAGVEASGPQKMKPLDALRAAMADLKKHFGKLDPEWGTLNRIRRGKVDLAIDGGPDVYRAVYGKEQSDGTFTAVAGDTFIMFVTWDKNGKLSSRSIHQFGSATLDKNSPHYADQTPLFVAMKTKPVLFTRAELKGHIEEAYRPGQRKHEVANGN